MPSEPDGTEGEIKPSPPESVGSRRRLDPRFPEHGDEQDSRASSTSDLSPYVLYSVPWTAWQIVLIVLLNYAFWMLLAFQLLSLGGFYGWWYGPDAKSLALEPAEAGKDRLPRDKLGMMAGPAAAAHTETTARHLAQLRMELWAVVLAFPFQALTIPFVLHRMSGARPEQIGLTLSQFGPNLLRGVVGWLILTPPVFAVNWLVMFLYSGDAGVKDHPFVLLGQQDLSPAEWFLIVFSATVTAPVLEEMLFRGVLQPWFAKNAWAAHSAMAVALLMALLAHPDQLLADWREGGAGLAADLAPVWFIVALIPPYLLVRSRSRTPFGPALFGTATLFAAVHSFAWPSPIPLFFLALGLGWLAHRTRSLVGPMVLHGLFNGVSCVLLFWS